jgi:N-acetyl-anhydromuramyl-L-alanine amidase AmpD
MNPLVINRVHRLPADQFYQESYPKKQIYIHHTVGGSAVSSINYWIQQPEKVGTAYLIDRDGTIYEVFDPRYWAHHLGLKHRRNTELNQRSIGIELASEGALIRGLDKSLTAFDGRKIHRDSYIDNQVPWRGYQYFDQYEPAQIKSLYNLVKHLCEQHSVPKRCIEQKESTIYDEKFFDFNGVLGHCNVRSDKTDPHPRFRFDHLQAFLNGADLEEAVPLP